MSIFDKYIYSFSFKNKKSIDIYYFVLPQKNINSTIHNTLFITSLHYYYYLYTLVNYKYNFYNMIHIESSLSPFLSNKSITKLF